MSFLLDTNIVSDLRRAGRQHDALREWFALQAVDELFLSVITLGEIRQGIEQLRRRDVQQARALDRWLQDLARLYAERLLSVDAHVVDEWGRLRAMRTVPVVDALLAATARVQNLTLVTRNEKDFAGLSVKILNPR